MSAPNACIQEEFIKVLNMASASANWDTSSLKKGADDISLMLDASQRILSSEKNSPNVISILDSNVPLSNVRNHLTEMKDVYDVISKMQTSEELYEYLLGIEDQYLKTVKASHFSYSYPNSVIEEQLKNSIFALRVHQLHPIM